MNPLDSVIVLAAGEGTRMKSSIPKVLHAIAGRSLLAHVLKAVDDLSPTQICVVVGAGREAVEKHIAEISPKIISIFQEERGGTGHAVKLALPNVNESGTVLIIAGDTPLITSETLRQIVEAHQEASCAVTVLTADHPQPTGYGRIIRNTAGDLLRIVEERDASEEEREISEINSGVYLFDLLKLRNAIAQLATENSQHELYLTDVIEILRRDGERVMAILTPDFLEILGVNNRAQLAECAALMRDQINDRWMREGGVTMIDPTTTWIDVDVEIDSDAMIFPGSTLAGSTKIGAGAIIGPRTTLLDSQVGAGAKVLESYCLGATIGPGADVGPFSYLRNGSILAGSSKVGAFVEMKNSTLGEGSKIPHLSYVGDAAIGAGTNIGAGTIFANYDGVNKHEITVGDQVRIGSDSVLVAPVSIGNGAYTAAGSVITEDVPSGAIGVGRARQRNVLEWVLRKRPGTKSADAVQSSKMEGMPTL